MVNRSISVGPDRDGTCDPWIRRQTSICTLVRYRLPYAPVGIYHTYTVFMLISIHLCGHKGPKNGPGASYCTSFIAVIKIDFP